MLKMLAPKGPKVSTDQGESNLAASSAPARSSSVSLSLSLLSRNWAANFVPNSAKGRPKCGHQWANWPPISSRPAATITAPSALTLSPNSAQTLSGSLAADSPRPPLSLWATPTPMQTKLLLPRRHFHQQPVGDHLGLAEASRSRQELAETSRSSHKRQ